MYIWNNGAHVIDGINSLQLAWNNNTCGEFMVSKNSKLTGRIEQPFEGPGDLCTEDVSSSWYEATLSSQWNLFHMIYNLQRKLQQIIKYKEILKKKNIHVISASSCSATS